MKPDFDLILVDISPAVCDAWTKYFAGLPNVYIINGGFESLPKYDCMVSAANSFGFMDGGVDGAIARYFGASLMPRVQQRIIEEWQGEQPVGTSMIVETRNMEHPFLAHTPTMRVPMPISRTDNVYLAMKAMLRAVQLHNQTDARKIATVACPGLGTATGRVPPAEAAYQMALAYENHLAPPTSLDWTSATRRQEKLRYGGDHGLILLPRTI